MPASEPDVSDAARDGSDAREPQRNRRPRRAFGFIALALLVALVATVGALSVRVLTSTDRVEAIGQTDAFPDDSARPEPFVGEGSAPLNILLLGTDRRDPGGSLLNDLGDRADTIMVLHIPPDRQTIQVVSIMRDSWVEIPGHGSHKVNSALSLGGVPLLVSTIESLIGQRIDDVAVIDFEGFAGLTETLGGVTVENEVAFSGRGYDFAAGPVTLETGEEALAYVRERYALSDGDYQRVRNQRAYVRAVMTGLLTAENLQNPLRVSDLIETMAPYMATTEGLSTSELARLGAAFITAGGVPEIQMFTLPTAGTGIEGTESVVYLDPAGLEVVRAAFLDDSMSNFVPPPDRPE